ncbi:MAG: amidohydrolase [Chloroflexi bacterium]|nr:amidohydrolase [Chloroflexota bacterium]
MHKGYKAADSDMHIIEPVDLWQRYIDPKFKHVAPVGMTQWRRDMRVMVKARVISRTWPRKGAQGTNLGWKKEQDELYALGEQRGWDPESQLAAMDREGLDLAVVYPSRGLFVLGMDSTDAMGPDGLEPDLAAAIARAYNDWLFDFCSGSKGRIFGAGMIAPHDIESAVSEARRCAEDLKFKAIFLLPGTVNRRAWHDPYYDPLWAACQRQDIAIGFHGGGRNFLTPDFGLEVFDRMMMYHTFTHPLGLMTALVSFTGGGILQRFPKIRVPFLEGNCSWSPWLMHRLDEHFKWVGAAEAQDLRKLPSEYFKANCYLSVEADEEPAKYAIDWSGDDNLVFSTDYPHGDSKYPYSIDSFLKTSIPEKSKRKILWDNCARLYKLNGAANASKTSVAKRAASKK